MSLAVVGELGMIKCLYGVSPSSLTVLPDRTVMAEGMLMGNITDCVSLINIMTFDECLTIENPEVEVATDAADGVLCPMPCIPVIDSSWVSEALTVIPTEGSALDETSIVMCTWTGVITVDEPGNVTIMVP